MPVHHALLVSVVLAVLTGLEPTQGAIDGPKSDPQAVPPTPHPTKLVPDTRMRQFRVVAPTGQPEDVPDIFFPFGSDLGDAILPPNDDGYSTPITISTPFRYFNNSYSTLYVNTNGLVSFNGGVPSFTPTPFPIADKPVMAAFWADVNTAVAGTIYYREVTDTPQLVQITEAILEVYAPRGLYYFKVTWAYMVTYYKVSAFGSSASAPRNTFQIVLATDGTHSFTIFNYGEINWTFGTASHATDAQVGFDAGDNTNYFAIPTSRTPDIVHVNHESNIGLPGRWMFRIDKAAVDAPEGCQVEGRCAAYEKEVNGTCIAVAPALTHCPELLGPELVSTGRNQYVYFTCQLPDQELTEEETYEIFWLFDGERDRDVPRHVFFVYEDISGTVRNLSFKLHEKYLKGHLGQWVSCEVVTHFRDNPEQSQTVKSEAYWAGVRPSDYEITVYENEEVPASVYLQSTIPIPCQPSLFPRGVSCYQRFLMDSSAELFVYQSARPETVKDEAFNCAFYLYSGNWNSTSKLSYRADLPLLVRTPVTAYTEPDLVDRIHFTANVQGSGMSVDEEGHQYESIWTGYIPVPVVVYRVDNRAKAGATCAATGDPRMNTLDGRYYSVYANGQFVMLRSNDSRQFEVQIRTYECAQTLSCTCGVVVREGNESLSLEMCKNLNVVHRIVRFADGAERKQQGAITLDSSGRRYTITMPSGAFVNVHTYYWGMNVLVHVLGFHFSRTIGLCGTFNNNPQDDFVMRDEGLDESSSLNAFINSWRIPIGDSYFERNPILIVPPVNPPTDFCACLDDVSQQVPCGALVDAKSFSFLTFTNNMLKPMLVASENDVNRNKRQATNHSTIEVFEVDATYDPFDFDYGEGSNNVRHFSWPTPSGTTEDEAREQCTEAIHRGACADLPQNQITIEKCLLDIKETDSFDWVLDKLGEAQFLCVQDILTQPISVDPNITIAKARELIEAETRRRVSQAQAIMCPNHCFEQGHCVNGTCQCRDGFTGVDCSLQTDRVLEVDSIAGGDVCDVRASPCHSVRVYTNDLFDSPQLACQIWVEDEESDGNRRPVSTEARFQGINEVICMLPDSSAHMQRLGKPELQYAITVTRDGTHYSSSSPYRVYDSLCQSCPDIDEPCSLMDNTCSVKGRCFAAGDVSDDRCFLCDPDNAQSEWSSNPDAESHCISSAEKTSRTSSLTIEIAVIVQVFILTVSCKI